MAGIPSSSMGQPCMYNDPSVYVKTEYDQGKDMIWFIYIIISTYASVCPSVIQCVQKEAPISPVASQDVTNKGFFVWLC